MCRYWAQMLAWQQSTNDKQGHPFKCDMFSTWPQTLCPCRLTGCPYRDLIVRNPGLRSLEKPYFFSTTWLQYLVWKDMEISQFILKIQHLQK